MRVRRFMSRSTIRNYLGLCRFSGEWSCMGMLPNWSNSRCEYSTSLLRIGIGRQATPTRHRCGGPVRVNVITKYMVCSLQALLVCSTR